MSDIFLNSACKRDVPSFIEPRPPLITNPFMRRRPQKGTNLMDLFEEDSTCDEPELVQVYLRLKPCTIPSNLYEVRGDRYLITSLDTTTAGHGRRTQHNVSKMYTFSHIFPEDTSQREIFDHVVKDNLKKLPEGRSFTLLTYGASGSGKTYTLMGTVASPGLVPRSLEYLFSNVEVQTHPVYKPAEGGFDTLSYSSQEYELLFVKRLRKLSAPLRDKYRRMSCQLKTDLRGSVLDLSKSKHYIWVSFIEIYNEGIYDLLAVSDRRSSKLVIREDSNGNVYVKGATQAFVRSGEEAYDVMVAGKHNLQVAATGVHAQSSRSHCIFTITMLTENDGSIVTSCVRLCDLAGSERARRTRNTGARMQESRAINTSLHVLERCLHSLRRKQAAANRAVIPYRESKLTRLLGAGLSGTRGESVTMVVTLNPSPEYAHETRHVLQLAAVAKDLQINNTVSDYPSSLESSTHDLSSSVCAELMKLRACNERLNFELIQCQNFNKELTALIDEKQATNADMMRELVDLAKEGSRQFYEPQIEALKKEIEELREEYEEIINDLKQQMVNGPKGHKIDQLMTEIATLKEKLTAEELARARAEEEIQHLRACIDERDGNDELLNNDDISVTESDSEEEHDDLCNESLEPTFKKEDINRTRLLRKSLVDLIDDDNEIDDDLDLNNTLKESSDDSVACAFSDNVKTTCKKNVSYDSENEDNLDLVSFKSGNKGSYFFNEDSNVNPEKTSLRGTYCVSSNDHSNINKTVESSIDEGFQCDNEVDDEPEIVSKNIPIAKKVTDTNKSRNDSLAQFEQFEMESKNCNQTESLSPDEFGKNLHSNTKGFFYHSEIKTEQVLTNRVDDDRSPSIIKDDVNDDYEPSMIKKLLKKKFLPLYQKDEHCNTEQEPLKDNKEIIKSKQMETLTIIPEHKLEISHESVDLFDSPRPGNKEIAMENLHNLPKKSIEPVEDSQILKKIVKKSPESNKHTIKRITSSDKQRQDKKVGDIFVDDIRKLSIADISHVHEVNGIEKETISTETDIRPLKTPSTILEHPETESTTPNQTKLELNTSINEVSVKMKDSPSEPRNLFKVPLPLSDNTKLDDKIKDFPKKTKDVEVNTSKDTSIANVTINNTLDAFEDIYKNITLPRVTEFDLLVSTTEEKDPPQLETETKYNLRQKSKKTRSQNNIKEEIVHLENNKKDNKEIKKVNDEILLESEAKCESKPKRNLRLRRRKDEGEQKLKDIANLQSEFSDVTMDLPAPNKVVEDIPSPKKDDEENISPLLGIQSCPSKSVTRSRRKLFTPRAEALEEICPQTVDSSNDQIRVPRPSYHRPRARRKL